jgi:AcrR family transcriptional regulator
MLDQVQQTRATILEAAESHFRRYGYAKTTMADIASACAMSPANLYRFFDSKNGIVGEIAERYLREMEEFASSIAQRAASASERLRAYVVEIHEKTVERYLSDANIHEICLLVVREQWPLCLDHIERMRQILSRILADGEEAGEFALDDPGLAAATLQNAMIKFHHPGVVTQCMNEPLEEQAEAMAGMLARALGK